VQKLLELRHRMKTVGNIKTVTGALATVSAAKLSRARARAESMHAYAERLREILYDQQEYMAGCGSSLASVSPLLRARDDGRLTLLLITGDRGMCGGYNLAVERFALEFRDKAVHEGKQVDFVAKGRKGEAYLRRRGASVVYADGWRREGVTAEEVRRLLGVLLDLYLGGSTDEVWVLFTRFYSPIRRQPLLLRLLPVEIKAKPRPPGEVLPAKGAELERWSYEPSLPEVIHDLLLVALLVQLHDVLLESYASEHGARMVTMKEAAERAEKTLRACRVAYNRFRREAITIDLLSSLFAASVSEEQSTMPVGAPAGPKEGGADGVA
jgi:F-type H+-transporting ATPase subunit gamma